MLEARTRRAQLQARLGGRGFRLHWVLLTAVLAGGLLTAVFSARSQTIGATSLNQLPTPRPLGFASARRMAVRVSANIVAHSRAQILGTTLAEHTQALADQLLRTDRPVRDPVYVTLQPGETALDIRRRWRLSENDFARLNPGVDLAAVDSSTRLCVWRFDPDNPPRSFYRPNRGRLQDGELMPEGEGWVIRNQQLAFATEQTIEGLIHGARNVVARYPGGQDLLIADLSSRNGGRLRPHRSHQSGRDADVSYYRLTDEAPAFSRSSANELDAPRTWEFVRTLLLHHRVDYIFMSRAIQEALYRYAESIGEHPAFLDQVFERGPGGHHNSRAPIRFARGHGDHMHIRFACAEGDFLCRSAH